MKKKTHILLFSACLLVAAFLVLKPRSMSAPVVLPEMTPLTGPVVVELFTSQNCPNCPPADDYLQQLSTRAGVMALGCHVTYMDGVGRKDPLSVEFCSERQRAFSTAQERGGDVYTPQMVINGSKGVIGNNGFMIVNALRDMDGQIKPISITKKENGDFQVVLPAHNIAQNHPTVLRVLFYGSDLDADLSPSRKLIYVRPVISSLDLVDHWDGTEKKIAIMKSSIPANAAGFAILAERTRDGEGTILAAGSYDSVR